MVSTNSRKPKASPGPDDIDIDLEVLAQYGPQIAVTQMLLRQHPGASSRTLAKDSGMSQPTMARVIKKIKELGLTPSQNDSEPAPSKGAPILHHVSSTSIESGVDSQGVTQDESPSADTGNGLGNAVQTPAPAILLEVGQSLEPSGGQVLVPLSGGQTLVLPKGQPLQSLEGHSLVPAADSGKPKAKPTARKPRAPKVWAPKPALHLVDPTFPDPSVPPEDTDLDLNWTDLAQGSLEARWLVSYLASKIDTKAVQSRRAGWAYGGRWNQMTPTRAWRSLKWADRLLANHSLYEAVLVVDYVFDSGWLGANPVADNGYTERSWSQAMEGGRRVTGLYQILSNFDELVASRARDIEGNNYDPEALVGPGTPQNAEAAQNGHQNGQVVRQEAAQPRGSVSSHLDWELDSQQREELRERFKAWQRENMVLVSR